MSLFQPSTVNMTSSPPTKKIKLLGNNDSVNTTNSRNAVSLERLTLVSMNIAGCHPSKEAPQGWGENDATIAIRDEILLTDPDILALQECPGTVAWATAVFPGYTAVGDTRSHMDYVILLVRKGIQAELVPILQAPISTSSVPAVLAKLSHGNRELLVASVHLAPFGDGNMDRRMEMEALIRTAGKSSTPLIIAGDTNMRVAEDKVMENQLELVEFWKLAGSDWKTKWTWDTKDHGTQFNRYYGEDTRQYNARYDRIYATDQSPEATLSVLSFELIANKPVTNKFHFLSDHFGISTTFQYKWQPKEGD